MSLVATPAGTLGVTAPVPDEGVTELLSLYVGTSANKLVTCLEREQEKK